MMKSWDDYMRERMAREDEPIRKKFAPFAHLGRGHLRPDLCRGVTWDGSMKETM